MRCNACRCNGAWGGGVFVSPAPAYADGYVAPDGNIYYGYKSDSNYSKERFKIEVHYYSNKEDADKDDTSKQDPLGQYVHVKYTANLNSADNNSFDKWAFRPMWWYGVPAGLTNVHNINYSRFEKYTGNGKPVAPSKPGSSVPGLKPDSDNVTKHYKDAKDWKSISRFYVEDPSKLKSMNGLAMLLGVDGKNNSGYDSNGTTAGNWSEFYDATKGMQGMFIDWESAGKRFYEMDYVAELTDDAWKKRDEHPLRFAAGVYRFAGNWHIATGQIHRAPKIADSLKVQYPERTPVANVNSLTGDEPEKVKTAINTANEKTPHFKDLLDETAGITVGTDGTATLTFKDKTTLTMPGNLLVVEKKKDNVKFPPVYPAPIGVVNPQNLSDADQQAIIQGFKTANKDKDFLTKVSDKDSDVYKFDNTKHELTITYKDGSSLTIPYDQLVYQGATIADWAPYVVPGYTEVVNPSSLTQKEITELIAKFDKANEKLGIYNAAKQNGKSPVTIATNGTATITWKDGSQTIVPGFLYLKKKAPEAPKPNPTGDEKKYFTVAVPTDISSVNFDPFNMKATDLTDQVNSAQLESIKDTLKALTATDTKDSNTHPQIIDVTFAVDKNGVGTVTFTADKYESATYPMGMFMKQNPNKQTPKETEHSPKGKTQYKYKVKPIQYDGNAPTPPQQIQALKDFVQSNYGTDISSDAGASGGIYVLKKTDIPVPGTSGLQFYDKDSSDGAGVATIDCTTSTDGSLTIQGYEKGDKNIKTLFTVPASELYVKRSASTDHTLSDLKQQAKDLLKKRKGEGLKDSDFAKAGIENPAKLNENTINGMNEQQLRDLIRKLTDAKKAERKYNEPGVVEFDKGATNDAKFKEAVKAFLKANYTNPEVVTDTSITSPLTLPDTLTAKNDTVYMGIDADGIKSLSKDASNNIVITASDNSTFTVNVKYKEKDATPSPTPGDDKQLQEMKKQAEELIDRNPKLTEEQKKSFDQQIKDAKNKEEIQNILKKANEQAGKNNVDPNDIKKKEKEEKEKREKEQKEKDKKEREEKQKQQLQDDKKKAKETLNNLTNLTDGDSGDKKKLSDEIDNAQTPEAVKKILDKAKAINDAKGALQNDITKGALPFLDHGNASDDKKDETSHADDVALHELLGGTSGKDQTLTDLEKALTATDATAESINNALAKAKLQNTSNEQNAKRAATAKLDALEQSLDDAYNKLSDTDKTAVNAQYTAAKEAITKAKTAVTNATKPSELLNAINSVNTSLNDANTAVNNKIDTEHNNNKKNNDHSSDPKELQKEKENAKGEIDKIPGLTKDEKDKYKEQIDDSTHSGDPEAIVNQAKKHKKIEDALKKLDEFKHLNDAQRDAFKKIIEDTDAHNHTDENGKDLGIDDIDVALANAANTDNAMARLEELKKTADDFSNGNTYKNFADKTKKDAFDAAYKAAKDVLDKADGDAKNADQVNELYKDLLKAMRAIDPDAKSAGLKTAALAAEIDSDKKLQPSETDPKTPGNPVYNTSSKAKKDDFDKALNEAQTVLDGAKAADISTADKEAAEQNEIDAALDKLIKARLALDGVNTKPLQEEIDKDIKVKDSDRYTYSTTTDKKTTFAKALQAAQDLIDKLTGKKQASADDNLDTKENKQKALDDALAKLKAAEAALDGHAPTPTPTPSVDKSHLQQGINGSGDVKKSDDYNNAPSDKKQAYDHALDHANEVNNNPNATQDQVNQAAEDLKKAEHDLKPASTPSVDKSHLQQGINGSDDVHNSDDYTNAPSDKKQAYDHALDHANEVNKDPNATQDQVNQATEDLKKAQKDLHDSATVDKSHLQSEVSDDVAFRARGSYLVADAPHKDAYNAALSEARRVLADPNATQAQVNAALSKLREAKRNILQANGLSGDEYAGDGNTGTGNTGSETGTGNAGTGAVPGGSSVVPGTVPGSGDSGFGSTGTSNAGTSNTGTTNSGVAGNGHEGDSSLGFGVNDNAPTTVDKGELNLQIQGAESDSQSANAGSNNAANAGNAGANNAANAGNAGANAGNAGANAAANNNAAVTAAVENNPAVKQADAQVAAAQAALDSALAEAKKVAADHNATQAQVDAAKRKLADARKNLADAQAHAAQVRASVRAQVLKSGKVAQLSNTGSAVSALSTFAATIAAAGAALFVSKRRGISRHCSK